MASIHKISNKQQISISIWRYLAATLALLVRPIEDLHRFIQLITNCFTLILDPEFDQCLPALGNSALPQSSG